jgi:outer membrane murein-binding lipoprotein Lpp
MIKAGKVIIIAVVLFSLVISGCADTQSNTQEQSDLSDDVGDTADQNLSVADELLNEEMVGITDTEMQDLEADLAELEAMLNEMDLEEDIVIEEI